MKLGTIQRYLTTLLHDYTDPKYGDPRESEAYRIVPILRSGPGVGKTSLFRQVSEDFANSEVFTQRADYLSQFFGSNGRTWGSQVIEPSQMDVPDVRGYLAMRKYERADGSIGHISEYSHPPVIEAPGDVRIGIRFVDELGQSEYDMQKALASMMLEGRTGDYSTGWLRWGATNRTTDSSGVKKMLAHFRNRIKLIEFEPQVEQLVKFCTGRGFPALAIGFIPYRPGVIFSDTVPRDDDPICTPRSFVGGVMELMMLSGGVGKDLRLDDEAREHMSGWIGKAAAAEFFAYMDVAHKVPTIEEVLQNPDKVRVPDEISMRFAMMGVVIHNVDSQNVGKLLTFTSRMPQEMQITMVHAFQARAKHGLFQAPEFAKWVRNNQDIIMAVQALSQG